MASPLAASVAILAWMMGLAGCVGGGVEPATLETSSGGNGGIRGVLVSEELFPVAGALVEIPGGAATESDEAGRFEFWGLREGEVLLNVSADGYEAKQETVAVPAEGFAEVRIAMIGIPGQSPYAVTLIHDGFNACSFSAVYSAGQLLSPCPLGASDSSFRTEVGPDWRVGVHELEWQTADEMLFASTLDGPICRASPPPPSKCAALVGGPSPLRILARPNDAEYAAKHAIDGKQTWPTGNYTSVVVSTYSGRLRTEINATLNPACQEINSAAGAPRSFGCPFGVGVSTGIRLRFYHTTFYLQSPEGLDTFSARPDG